MKTRSVAEEVLNLKFFITFVILISVQEIFKTLSKRPYYPIKPFDTVKTHFRDLFIQFYLLENSKYPG